MWRWAVERDRRSVGVEGDGMERTRSKQHRGVSRNLWSNRLFVVCLPQTLSQPLRAVSGRLLGVSEDVALLLKCRRGLPSVHRGERRAYNQGAKALYRHCSSRSGEHGDAVERYRRKGYVPGELASEVCCGTGVKRCQRSDPARGGDVALTHSPYPIH